VINIVDDSLFISLAVTCDWH